VLPETVDTTNEAEVAQFMVYAQKRLYSDEYTATDRVEI
jgi:hypothetical protein